VADDAQWLKRHLSQDSSHGDRDGAGGRMVNETDISSLS
jgi:hypothetical protein